MYSDYFRYKKDVQMLVEGSLYNSCCFICVSFCFINELRCVVLSVFFVMWKRRKCVGKSSKELRRSGCEIGGHAVQVSLLYGSYRGDGPLDSGDGRIYGVESNGGEV